MKWNMAFSFSGPSRLRSIAWSTNARALCPPSELSRKLRVAIRLISARCECVCVRAPIGLSRAASWRPSSVQLISRRPFREPGAQWEPSGKEPNWSTAARSAPKATASGLALVVCELACAMQLATEFNFAQTASDPEANSLASPAHSRAALTVAIPVAILVRRRSN